MSARPLTPKNFAKKHGLTPEKLQERLDAGCVDITDDWKLIKNQECKDKLSSRFYSKRRRR